MATRSIFAFLGTLLLAGAAHAAGTPLTLSTSGYLLDAADHPLTQQGVSLRFSVWKDPASPSDANRAWPATGESTCLVDVKNGFYTAVFDGSQLSGCGAGLTSEFLPPGLERYLQVSVEGTTLTPRLRIGTVPNAAFAAQSGDAQTLIATLAASGTLNADGNPVDWTKLKAVPPGFADGTDADTTYTAGSGGGLSLVGNAFSITAGSVTNTMLQTPSVTVSAGTGLTGGGSAALGGSTTLSLADTTVAANTYSHPTLTIDAQGRITAASSNAVTSGTVTSVATGTGLSGGPITASGTIAIANDGVTAALLASDPASLSKVSGGGMTASGGKIGIGTTSPSAMLDVMRTETTPNSLFEVARFHLANGAADRGLAVLVPTDGMNAIGLKRMGTGSTFVLRNQADLDQFVLDDAGNVGIGTTSPQSKLDVNGSVHVTGNVKTDGTMTSVAFTAHDSIGDWCRNCAHDSSDGEGNTKRIVMNAVDANVGNAYNPATGELTAPTAGLYMICLNFLHGDQTDDYVNFRLWINDTWPPFPSEHFLYDTNDYTAWAFMQACEMVPLNAGDRLGIQVYGSRGIYENPDENHERLYGWKL